jgi:16S rRNA (cytosine967-C5)-methyltransferase
MTPAARIAAAIEVLSTIAADRSPASEALKAWGKARRFAGSGDRAGIASLVFDALRRRSSAAWVMGADTPRAIVLGALREARGMEVDAIANLCNGEGHAPSPLTDDERERLTTGTLDGAPDHVRGDFPEWLTPSFAAVFGEHVVEEARSLAERASVDLRVNTLKGTRDEALKALAHLNPEATAFSPVGMRIAVGLDGRGPALQAEPAYVRGKVEVQDEGSQLASLLAGVTDGMQVLDLCAGGGGKSLALAAIMDNRGQIFATDHDGRRLTPIFARLERSGVRNVQVRAPRGPQDILADIADRCDVVFVDAPCTGVGAWRRNPDAKWRTRPGALEQRQKDQDAVLESATRYVKPGGGVLCYVTCSLLREENEDRIAAFLEKHGDFLPRHAEHMARMAGVPQLAEHASPFGPGIRLSPRSTGTDGFYVVALVRN